MKNISEYFGCLVFDDRVMKANLSAKVYQSLMKEHSLILAWQMQLQQR